MEKSPRVSVVLPTYNRAGTLKRSIQSVLSQSITDLEIIVVDDASKDETETVVCAFGDDRIRYIKNKKNLGGAESRNVGIQHAKAPIIAFQDSDDEWLPMKLERCLYELENNKNLLGVYSGFWQIKDHYAHYMPCYSPPSNNKNITTDLLYDNFVDTPTVVLYKTVLNKCGGFDKEMPRFQDWELFIRLSSLGIFSFIDEPLILSYVTPGNISSDKLAKLNALERIYQKNSDRIESNRKLYAEWNAKIGDAHMRAGIPRYGRKMLIKSLWNDKFNLRFAVKTILSLLRNKTIYVTASKLFEKKGLN